MTKKQKRRLVRKIVAHTLEATMFISLLMTIGTVGALECDDITFTHFAVQGLISLVIFGGSIALYNFLFDGFYNNK